MKAFSDIIDATNQALDEFTSAFEEAGEIIEKRRTELKELISRSDLAISKLDELISKLPAESSLDVSADGDGAEYEKLSEFEDSHGEEDRVELIRRHLGEGISHEDISRRTGASIREIQLVEKLSNRH